MTLRDLARDSRVSLPYLSEIERGRKEVSSEILDAVCRVLDLTLSQLLDSVAAELARAEVPQRAGTIRGGRQVVSIESMIELRVAEELRAGERGEGPTGPGEVVAGAVDFRTVLLAA